jgi:hypothetical protein
MSSFTRMATVTASTKRPPALDADGQRGEPETHLAELFCTPLDPADSEQARDLALRLRQVLDSPFKILETFVGTGLDIVEGDVLVVSGREYPIRGVNPWVWRGAEYLHLLLEDSKP